MDDQINSSKWTTQTYRLACSSREVHLVLSFDPTTKLPLFTGKLF
jgi:hypothetical protein